MPLTFANANDYDELNQNDDLVFEDLFAGLDSGTVKLVNKTSGKNYNLSCSFTERQKAILKAGGLLKYTKEN